MLEARHLSKRYLGSTVVHDLDLCVAPGEIVGYLGPNGSGKSTTVKMLTGLVEPSGGVVLWNRTAAARDWLAFRQRLGYIPEEPHLYGFQSGREFLELVGRLRNLPPARLEAKIDALLALFGMQGDGNRSIASYSKGMKQKVVIIAALLHDPDVLILDEPDSGLDVTATLILRHVLQGLAGRGKAILYSSHVLDLVERLCHRVVVIHRGRVVANDSVDRLRGLRASGSLEEVFSQLVLKEDPERTAADIVAVVSGA